MSEKLVVGANLADSNRPQVYHAGYTPGPDNRRTKDGYEYALPWHCTLDNMSVNDGFRTHAEAIAYADKLARGKKETP